MTSQTSGGGRLLSLDVFRGATIVAMILVNNPGTWSAIYPPLRHAEWHGWTPTDLVFPFFLFIVGVAIPLALDPRIGPDRDLSGVQSRIVRRSVLLFLLGLGMAVYPLVELPLTADSPGVRIRTASWETLRIMGVLQRIAICYLVVATAHVHLSRWAQRWWTGVLLLGSWAALVLVPVPGLGAGRIDEPVATLSAWIDRALLGTQHLWVGADRQWDPEGLFSTLPAIGTTFLGLFAGQLLREGGDRTLTTVRLFVRGALLTTLGGVWSWFLPLNKSLWTSSYAVFTAGLGFSALAVCFWFLDARPRPLARRLSQPLVVYGVNALTVFVLSGLLAKTLGLVRVPLRLTWEAGLERTSLQSWIHGTFFEPLTPLLGGDPRNPSLLYALVWIGGWYLVLRWMHRRNIFLKV